MQNNGKSILNFLLRASAIKNLIWFYLLQKIRNIGSCAVSLSLSLSFSLSLYLLLYVHISDFVCVRVCITCPPVSMLGRTHMHLFVYCLFMSLPPSLFLHLSIYLFAKQEINCTLSGRHMWSPELCV